jgi:hypothetical protein
MAAPALFFSALTAVQALAGGECRPPKDSSEAKLLAWFTAPIAFSPAGHTERLAPGAVRLSLDVTYVPAPGRELSRATYCRQKSETTDLSPVFPRPRVAIGLPGGLFVEGSYLPPVQVMDATPNLGSVALGWSRTVLRQESGGSAWVTVRAHATMGEVRGAITCSKQALQIRDNRAPCYGITPSDDRYEPRMVGGELAIGWRGTGSISAYLGGGYTDISPRLQVNFKPGGIGFLDNTRVLLDDSRIAAFAGGQWRVSPRAALTAEVYSVPRDLTTIRVGASWQLRGAP